MKRITSILLCVFLAVTMLVLPAAIEGHAATEDQIIAAQDSDFVPLSTIAPDSSLKYHPDEKTAKSNGAVFYTQTTLLALVAGYLVIYKIRCVKPLRKPGDSRRRRLR